MLIAVAEIGFAMEENTIMSQVRRSRPRSRHPSSPEADLNVIAAVALNVINAIFGRLPVLAAAPSLCGIYVYTI